MLAEANTKMPDNCEEVLPEAFPFGFEVIGGWEDPATLRRKTWVRFFSTDPVGRQAGRDAFNRLFESIDFLAFTCARGLRVAALEAHGGHWDRCRGYRFWVREDLTPADREQIAEMLGARTTAPPAKLSPMRDDLMPEDRERIAEILSAARAEEESE
jgi:hypothetical protein